MITPFASLLSEVSWGGTVDDQLIPTKHRAMIKMKIVVTKVFLSCAGLTLCMAAQAADASETASEDLEKTEFKLIPSYYPKNGS